MMDGNDECREMSTLKETKRKDKLIQIVEWKLSRKSKVHRYFFKSD